jgi:DNA-binding response OmpR family regulator
VRLLIVEDDYLVGSQMAYALEDAGFTVAAIVTSAEDAIGFARSEAVSLAIMDVRLAGDRDGVDCALELFRDYGVRCIFATAHGDADVKARAQPAKPLGWIQKPYSMTSLIADVRMALDTRE